MVGAGPEEVPLVDPVPVRVSSFNSSSRRSGRDKDAKATEHASHGASVVAYLSQIGEPQRVRLLKRSEKQSCALARDDSFSKLLTLLSPASKAG